MSRLELDAVVEETPSRGGGAYVALPVQAAEVFGARARVAVPGALADALAAAGLRERFDALSYSHRREYVRWITEARREATCQSRVEKAVAMVAAARPR